MAKVEMDLSELDEMRKRSSQLEESLMEQKTLHLKIEKSEKDKSKALKVAAEEKEQLLRSASKQVVFRRKVAKLQTVASTRPVAEIIRRIAGIANTWDRWDGGRSGSAEMEMRQLVDSCFVFNEHEVIDSDDQIIETKGLGEVKEELRAEVEKDFQEEVKANRKALEEIKEKRELWKESDKLRASLKETEDKLMDSNELSRVAQENLADAKQKYNDTSMLLEQVINRLKGINSFFGGPNKEAVEIIKFIRDTQNAKKD